MPQTAADRSSAAPSPIDFAPPLLPSHPLDQLSLGKIVQIRERLLAAQALGKRVYRFESGDPSFAPPAHAIDAITQAAHAGKTHYVPNNGIPELRRALARKVAEKNGLTSTTADDIFVTNGAMHALYVAFGALLDAGDEVIIPDPMWTEVAENIRLAGGIPVGVPLSAAHDFAYRVDDIAPAITARTKAIFLNTPHNPTGAVLPRAELAAMLDLARRHNLHIVSDEAYEDVIYAPHVHHSIGSLAHEDETRVHSAEQIEFRCECDTSRISAVLKSYSDKERAGLADGDGIIRARCEFCGKSHEIAPADLAG